ncbi:ATP-binding protein [Nonomuraea sp. NPDC050202]|uniref:ATP-binding protein n=1 Tax=Nonomuraea sp. NPDC050202 TaxID=3155035 RepID=UPI00340C500A
MNTLSCAPGRRVKRHRRRPTAPTHHADAFCLSICVSAVSGGRARRVSWIFDPVVSSVPAARHRVGAQARQWGFSDETDTVELLVTEVIANAVEHSEEAIGVQLTADDGSLRVEVEDHGARAPLPPARLAGSDEESGRGLFLLQSLAHEWGADETATGKVVWFELARDLAAADSAA